MIALLGGSGYVGQALHKALMATGEPVVALRRGEVDYGNPVVFEQWVSENKPNLVVNAAGHTGRPNVDACEVERAQTLAGNVILPLNLAHILNRRDIPLAQVSSGCIYNGALLEKNGVWSAVADLNDPEARRAWETEPARLRGFNEDHLPNFSFRSPPCSFYSGSKALAEETLATFPKVYLWRLRIPFDEVDSNRNFLSKIQRYPRVYDNLNSLSHLGDFASACVTLYQKRAPYGTYNIVNPGVVSTRQVVEMLIPRLGLKRAFSYFENDRDFYSTAAKAPRSNCLLDTEKLAAAGVSLRPVTQALEAALAAWVPEMKS